MPAELATIPKQARNYTGERVAKLRPRAYRKAIALLAADVPINQIIRTCAMTHATVEAIRQNEAISITDRKESLAGLAHRIASGAGEQIEDALAAHKLPVQSLPVVFGVAVDKLMLLSDQPTARIKLDVEVHDLSRDFQALHAEIINTMKQANAIEITSSTVPVPSLTDPAQA